MGTPSVGTVVLIHFPFSDLSQSKSRPAIVLADAGRGDWVMCQITSNPYGDSMAVPLTNSSFASGSLHRDSFARPAKLFTADENLVNRRLGQLKIEPLRKVVAAIIQLLQRSAG